MLRSVMKVQYSLLVIIIDIIITIHWCVLYLCGYIALHLECTLTTWADTSNEKQLTDDRIRFQRIMWLDFSNSKNTC